VKQDLIRISERKTTQRKKNTSELSRDKLCNVQFLETALHLLHSILGSLEYRNPQVCSSVPGKHLGLDPKWDVLRLGRTERNICRSIR
jgi:hypothetical protein